MNTTLYEKLLTTTRYWLTGLATADARYFEVLRALEFFAELHGDETRRNGARGFYHQLSILSFVRNYHPMLTDPVAVYITILGHDSVEDYPQLSQKIMAAFPEHYRYFVLMSKIRDGEKISMAEYFEGIESCAVCVIAKAADRIHNMSTMADKGAFSYTKQEAYAEETRMYFIPMLKTGRRRFPSIEPICEAFKSVLYMQLHATDRLLEAVKKSTTSMAPKAIEEKREAFQDRFKIDLWAVADWLRNEKLLAEPEKV